MDIATIFTLGGAVKSIGELLGVVESLESKINRLVRSELNAGLRNLEQARISETEREHLIREARASFNRAVSLESGVRRALALLGCATCHHLLGDQKNVRPCLEELVALPVEVGIGAVTKGYLASEARDFVVLPVLGLGSFVRMAENLRSMSVQQVIEAEDSRKAQEIVSHSGEAQSHIRLKKAVAIYLATF